MPKAAFANAFLFAAALACVNAAGLEAGMELLSWLQDMAEVYVKKALRHPPHWH